MTYKTFRNHLHEDERVEFDRLKPWCSEHCPEDTDCKGCFEKRGRIQFVATIRQGLEEMAAKELYLQMQH